MTANHLLLTAQNLLQTGRLSEAELVCSQVLTAAPDSREALMLQAAILASGPRKSDAERILNGLLSREPDFFPATYYLAEVYRLTGRLQPALENFCLAFCAEFTLPAAKDALQTLDKLLGLVANEPASRWQHRLAELRTFGWLIEKLTPPEKMNSQVLFKVEDSNLVRGLDGQFQLRFSALSALLAFYPGSSREWNALSFERYMLPAMLMVLRDGQYDNAFAIESSIYASYVKQTETDEHFASCFAKWTNEMRTAGKRFAAGLPSVIRSKRTGLPRIAFFVHNLTLLAHVRILLDVLEGHAELANPLFEPFVFYLSVSDQRALDRFHQAGVKTIALAQASSHISQVACLSALRRHLAEQGVDALVWISMVLLMPFAFAMRLAPAQIWWAMKYHSLDFPEIDGYVTAGGISGGTKQIGGRPWRAGPVAAIDWVDQGATQEAALLRAGYSKFRILFGSLGREEKLNSERFLDAVCQILKAVPDAAFLWTGRTQHAGIQARLNAAGIAERCVFIGWVNTKLYAQVIDIFLDSFPFPCGFTLYEAMAAGKPAVLFSCPESRDTGANALIGPLLRYDAGDSEDARMAHSIFTLPDGESLYLSATDLSDYVSKAIRLAQDDAYRSRAGRAMQAFVDQFMADRKRAAKIYANHFISVLDAKASGE